MDRAEAPHPASIEALMQNEPLLREYAYLVARGVRALALVGRFSAEPRRMFECVSALECASEAGVVPFVIDCGDGFAVAGYAAARWALDLYQWTFTDGVPDEQRHRIVGLLLGYAPDAIRQFEESAAGRRFDLPTPQAG